MTNILGIDVGGTHTRFGVVANKVATNVEKIFTKDINNFPQFIKQIVDNYPDISLISIGIPGIVSGNTIVSVPNVKGLELENLGELITELTGIDVIFNKDVNLLLTYDLDRLDLNHKEDVLAFYLGTGLGNACKINGKLLKGNNGFAGELGHIPIIGNTLQCNCGKIGCAETIVSGQALLKLYNELHFTGGIQNVFVNYNNHQTIRKFIKDFALLVSIEINIIDCLTIIVGGGVPNMKDFPTLYFESIIKEELRSNRLINELEIQYVDDSPMNGIIGASLIIKE